MSESLFWLAVGCCAIAQLFIVRSALKPNRIDVQEGVPVPRRASEIAWTIVPGFLLALLFVWTWRTMHERVTAIDHHAPSVGALASTGPGVR